MWNYPNSVGPIVENLRSLIHDHLDHIYCNQHQPACALGQFLFWFFTSFIYHLVAINTRLSRRYFACMVDYHHPSRLLIAFVALIVSKKFPMRGLCVIFYGLILMIDVGGAFHLVAQDIHLARFSRSHYSPTFLVFCLILSWRLTCAFFHPGYIRTI
jgi:hypothetical protein